MTQDPQFVVAVSQGGADDNFVDNSLEAEFGPIQRATVLKSLLRAIGNETHFA